jgi:hypothetical protein
VERGQDEKGRERAERWRQRESEREHVREREREGERGRERERERESHAVVGSEHISAHAASYNALMHLHLVFGSQSAALDVYQDAQGRCKCGTCRI